MGRLKSFFPILLALVIALAGSSFVYKWLDAKTGARELVEVQASAVPVVVSMQDLPWGSRLSEDMLKIVPFLEESLPRGYASDPKTLIGRVLTAAVSANDPITESKIAPDNVTIGGVSAVLPPGKRAIAVKGDKVIGISGFIRPGHMVDVLVTLKDPKTDSEITKLVLEKIPVLATGTEIQENDKGDAAPVDVYTLEVTPGEAEKLTLAATRGILRFALRNITDAETVLTRGATISETLLSLREDQTAAEAAPAPKRPPARRRIIVEQIQGDKVSQKSFYQ